MQILDKINSEKRESEAISSNQQQLKELQQQIDDLVLFYSWKGSILINLQEINLRDNPSRKLVQKSTITRIADNEQQEFLYFLFTGKICIFWQTILMCHCRFVYGVQKQRRRKISIQMFISVQQIFGEDCRGP